MKKLLGIVVLGLLWVNFMTINALSANGSSKDIVKIKIFSKDKNHIRIKRPGDGLFKRSPYYSVMPDNILQTAKKHCATHKKNTYIYFRQKWKKTQTKNSPVIGYDTWYDGIGLGSNHYNFICATKIQDVFDLRTRYHKGGHFADDLITQLKKSEKPIEFKRELSQSEIAEIKIKKLKKEKKRLAELEKYEKDCTGSLAKTNFTKGTKEYENCLVSEKKRDDNKKRMLAKKLAAMTPTERHAYNCTETFKFKKGTEKFNDCVFKLYTAELDLQKLELEKEVAEAKIKAAATEQARAEAVANAQIAAAKSAKRSSDLNNSIQLMKLGSSMLGGSTSTSSSSNSFDINNRTRTTCRVVGGFLNCY